MKKAVSVPPNVWFARSMLDIGFISLYPALFFEAEKIFAFGGSFREPFPGSYV